MDNSRIYFGDKLKAIDDKGTVGGYLVRFTDASKKDLDGEYFTADTYLGPRDGDGVDTYFHHAVKLKLPDKVDAELKAEVEALSEYQFAPVKTKRDAIGIFAEVVLDMAKEYEKAVYSLVMKGKLGWSSGAIDHLVRVNADGRIKRWPIGEASLTPTPCEPQNRAVPIKSLSSIESQFLKGVSESDPLESIESVVSTIEMFTQKMQSNHDNRVKDGRVLSATNRAKVQAAHDALAALLEASEVKPKDEGKAASVEALRTQSLRLESMATLALVGGQ